MTPEISKSRAIMALLTRAAIETNERTLHGVFCSIVRFNWTEDELQQLARMEEAHQ